MKMKVKYEHFTVLQVAFFSLKFVGIVFVSSYDLASASSLSDSITSSHVIAESSIILAKYIRCLQLHAAGFQT